MLFGDEKKQGTALRCFMPIDQQDYQSAPPTIVIHEQRQQVALIRQ
jgi:hypothetical protein